MATDERIMADRTFSDQGLVFQKPILSKLFGNKIKYNKWSEGPDLGVDATLIYKGKKRTIQIKCIRFKNYHYRCVSLEWFNNRFDHTRGEFYQDYDILLHGVADSDYMPQSFVEYYIYKARKLKRWVREYFVSKGLNTIEKMEQSWYVRYSSGSLANFIRVPYDDVPRNLIIKSYKK